MPQPKAFVIAIKDHPISEQQLLDCKASAIQFGWNVETYWGVSGHTLTGRNWTNIGVIPLVLNSSINLPGQQGCFFSHWNLWNKCIEIDEPIIILEHDAVIQDKWSGVESDYVVTKLHDHYKKDKLKCNSYTGVWTPSSHAYHITPISAKKIINFARSVGALPVDVMLGRKVVHVRHLGTPELVSRQNTYSTTHHL